MAPASADNVCFALQIFLESLPDKLTTPSPASLPLPLCPSVSLINGSNCVCPSYFLALSPAAPARIVSLSLLLSLSVPFLPLRISICISLCVHVCVCVCIALCWLSQGRVKYKSYFAGNLHKRFASICLCCCCNKLPSNMYKYCKYRKYIARHKPL